MPKIFSLLLFFLPVALFAQDKTTPLDPEKASAAFMEQIGAGNVDQAYDQIFAETSWIAKKQDTLDLVKNKTKNLLPMLGKYIGSEELMRKEVGDCLIGYTYIARYERQPIRFVFIFYKPGDTWQTQSVNFDDDLTDDIKAALKKLP